MNTLKSIIKYLFSKFLYLILIIGLPSIFAGFTMTGKGIFDLIMHFNEYNFTGFSNVYMTVLSRNPNWLYLQPIAFLFLALGLSLLYATIDSHMRMGDFSIRNIVRKLDYNFIPSFKFVFSLAVTDHLIMLLVSSLTYLYYRVIGGRVAWTLTIVTIFLLGLAFMAIVTWLLLWLPTMLHTGLRDSRSFVMASKQIGPVFIKTMSTLLIPTLPYVLFMLLNSAFNWGVAPVFDILFSIFFGVWSVVTMNTVYYDLNNIEREDLKKLIWNIK